MKSAIQSRNASEKGLTLLELLTVISIIGVLVALLLPAVQAARLAANAQANRANLVNLGAAMETYRNLNGHYAGSLPLLAQSGVAQELLTGSSSGYSYSILTVTPVDFVVQGTPAAPGQTGVEQCTFNHTKVLRCGSAPGADSNASVMWTRIAARGAFTIANAVLESTAGVTAEQIRDHLALPSTAPTVFQQLDTNNDGQVGITDILQSGLPNAPDLSKSYGAFLVGVSQDMTLGAGNEHVDSLPGVRIFQLSSQRLCEGRQWSPCLIFPEPPQQYH